MFSLFILVFLATLGSLFGWIALDQVMAFPSLLYYLGIIAIYVLEAFAVLSAAFGKNKNREDSHKNTDNML